MARVPIESDTDFSSLLSSLTDDTVTASIHWHLYKDLWASVPEFVKELNQSPAFWNLTFNAHREVAVFRLSRLYDQRPGMLSLPSLVHWVAANLHFFDEGPFRERLKDNPFVESLAQDDRRPDATVLKQDADAVSKSDQLVKKLVAIRNRVLAHRDPTVVLGTQPDPWLKMDGKDIDKLLGRAAAIVNRYGSMFRAASSSMRMVGQDDFRHVLEYVRRGMASREKQIADEIARAQAQHAVLQLVVGHDRYERSLPP